MPYVIVAWTLVLPQLAMPQVAQPFKIRYQNYIKGDITLLANQIVNRVDGVMGANTPYNVIDRTAKINDEWQMAYVDIDDDPTTFSSSSADLQLDIAPSLKIKYAGLYWSATYKYEKGKQKNDKSFVAINKERQQFDRIKVKLPGEKNYSEIQGNIIFDGFEKEHFLDNAPYAVYADLTERIAALKNPNGTYTVANIKATVGTLSGGASGGWTLVVVFEDQRLTERQITSFDGFAGVTTKSTQIDFYGFTTLPEGAVNATLLGAALEGDRNLRGDALFLKTSSSTKEIAIESAFREKNNFFNSSLSPNPVTLGQRNPNSSNTLGYDAFVVPIENPDNAVISNNTDQISIRMKAGGDRYFLFFCALSIEGVVSTPLADEPIVAATESPTQNKETAHSPAVDRISHTPPNPKRDLPKQGDFLVIPDLNKGYYLVANVFNVPNNAVRFIQKLQESGFHATSFINPKNNYHYVYLGHFLDRDAAIAYYQKAISPRYVEEIWIVSINLE